MEFKKTDYINRLFDIYRPLLTDKQQEIIEYYFQDDLSLSEIADNLEISRNAVHNLIQRTIKILEDYESKLHLYAKRQKLSYVLEDASEELRQKIEEIIEG